MRARTHTDPTSLDELASDWQRLVDVSQHPSLFVSWEWLTSWWRTYSAAGARRLHLVTVENGGRIVGLLPLCTRERTVHLLPRGRSLEFLGTRELPYSDYLFPLLDATEEQAQDRILDALVDCVLASDDWDGLHLTNTLPDEPFVSRLADAAHGQGLSIRFEAGGHGARTALPSTWAEYFAGRARTVRKRTRWERNKVMAMPGAQLLRYRDSSSAVDDGLRRLARMHNLRIRERYGIPGSFEDRRFACFVSDFSHLAAKRGWLRLAVLTCDDGDLAAALCFQMQGTFYYYLTGRSGIYPKLSCGQVLLGLCIEEAIDEGARALDMLAGAESYKRHWAGDAQACTTSVAGERKTARGQNLRLYHRLRSGRDRLASGPPKGRLG